jgi:hypothetical protein
MDNTNASQQLLGKFMGSLFQRRNAWLGVILLTALLGFEAFNYSTTFTALNDLLGDMRFAGVRWATILALAFSSIDFAGIARMFSNDKEETAGREIWFLFIAWLLAATMNATLTWWGVSLALVNHSMSSTSLVDANVLMRAVPIFVAIMVWVTRILLISSISSAGTRFLASEPGMLEEPGRALLPAQNTPARPRPTQNSIPAARPAALQASHRNGNGNNGNGHRPAPVQPASAAQRPNGNGSARPQSNRPAPAAQSYPPNAERPAPAPSPRPNAVERPAAPASRPNVDPPTPARSRPQADRPPVGRSSPRSQPPIPPPPPPEEEEFGIEEPEYIPDPNYLPSQSAFHSLSARGSKGTTAPRQS